MNVLDLIAYILVALGVYRLYITKGNCPGGWASLAIGGLLLYKRPLFNV